MKNEVCDFCMEGKLEEKVVKEYFKYKGELVIIQNVPTYICNKCGEHYHTAKVFKQMRKIAENKGKIKKKISIPITNFCLWETTSTSKHYKK